MGVSYTAYAVIGVRVPRRSLLRTAQVSGCGHEKPPGARFCPQCGKPALVESAERVEGYDPEARSEFYHGTLFGLPLVKVMDSEFYYVVGLGLRHDKVKPYQSFESSVPVSGAEVEEARGRLREKLRPAGLWDEGQFGLWCLLDVS